jgi:hypothetical protein
MPLAKGQPRFTYADYLAWDKDGRYEIIDGEAYMPAAPSRIHLSRRPLFPALC